MYLAVNQDILQQHTNTCARQLLRAQWLGRWRCRHKMSSVAYRWICNQSLRCWVFWCLVYASYQIAVEKWSVCFSNVSVTEVFSCRITSSEGSRENGGKKRKENNSYATLPCCQNTKIPCQRTVLSQQVLRWANRIRPIRSSNPAWS